MCMLQEKENKKGGLFSLCAGGKSSKSKKVTGNKPLEGGPQGDIPPPIKDELNKNALVCHLYATLPDCYKKVFSQKDNLYHNM